MLLAAADVDDDEDEEEIDEAGIDANADFADEEDDREALDGGFDQVAPVPAGSLMVLEMKITVGNSSRVKLGRCRLKRCEDLKDAKKMMAAFQNFE